MLVFGACGGRSDQDALAGIGDAGLIGRDTGPRTDASPVTDGGAADTLDASVEVGPLDGGRFDAIADVRVDARNDGATRVLVSIAVTPPAATLVIGSKLSLTVTGTYSDRTTAD